eukprot:4062043-Pyramimonas_sp.AAC.1
MAIAVSELISHVVGVLLQYAVRPALEEDRATRQSSRLGRLQQDRGHVCAYDRLHPQASGEGT